MGPIEVFSFAQKDFFSNKQEILNQKILKLTEDWQHSALCKGPKKKKQNRKAHPIMRAVWAWKQVASQIHDLLGPEIFFQWFSGLIPIVISDNVLILEAKSSFQAEWLSSHYKELMDLLISFQDEKLSCFVLHSSTSLKGATSHIES